MNIHRNKIMRFIKKRRSIVPSEKCRIMTVLIYEIKQTKEQGLIYEF